uniref:Structural maintenance of chromosomes protein 5 n=1 Tax=Meloidogyne javanica TaxID=6303 RepID=A0A915NAI4_MELJA
MNRISEDKENKIEPQDSFEEDYESTIPPVVNRQLGHGCIEKIVFKNFLTYNYVECRPGPYLNVIIGPNGTGKSSIICGICLALGGSPKILGRSDNISDFVMHGKDEGSVELSIHFALLGLCEYAFFLSSMSPDGLILNVWHLPCLKAGIFLQKMQALSVRTLLISH